jgi:hypothetical protein
MKMSQAVKQLGHLASCSQEAAESIESWTDFANTQGWRPLKRKISTVFSISVSLASRPNSLAIGEEKNWGIPGRLKIATSATHHAKTRQHKGCVS